MAKNLIGGDTTTIIENGNDIAVDLNTDYKDTVDSVGSVDSLETTDKTSIVNAINENKGRLDDLVYTEIVTLTSGQNFPANNSPATAVYTLSPRDGYVPILIARENTYVGYINLWYTNLSFYDNNWHIAWRAHNLNSTVANNITIRVRVLYVKEDSFLGQF